MQEYDCVKREKPALACNKTSLYRGAGSLISVRLKKAVSRHGINNDTDLFFSLSRFIFAEEQKAHKDTPRDGEKKRDAEKEREKKEIIYSGPVIKDAELEM